jgi:hypothetical protein
MKTLEQHVDEVMDWFDFNKVKKVMDFLDWKWTMDCGSAVPEIADMRKLVRKYMRDLYQKYSKEEKIVAGTGSGGFYVEYRKGIDEGERFDDFSVSFSVGEWYTGE